MNKCFYDCIVGLTHNNCLIYKHSAEEVKT